jgi:hypothetical protein
MPEHDWENCEMCQRNLVLYGESFFDPKSNWHPRPTLLLHTDEEGWTVRCGTEVFKVGDLLHRLKDGEVVHCLLLN